MPESHISVCICTYKRPDLLVRTLHAIERQAIDPLFTFSVVVADNDRERSAAGVVAAFAERAPFPVTYCVEPEQNIAMVRNQAIASGSGDYVAFIDDDERPSREWLRRLYEACQHWNADGVLGPVLPYFDSPPPKWVRDGKFFERPSHPDGYRLRWDECRTGNVLFKRIILGPGEIAFRPQFGTAGEDMDFFRRMIDKGCCFRWCDSAPVHELVPANRCTWRFQIRRALLRGSNFPKHPANRVKNIAKSLIAVPLYTLAMPVFAVSGSHVLLKFVIKLADHSSRLLAFSGIVLANERES